MPGLMILSVAVIYTIASCGFLYEGKVAQAVIFGSYAISNVGLFYIK